MRVVSFCSLLMTRVAHKADKMMRVILSYILWRWSQFKVEWHWNHFQRQRNILSIPNTNYTNLRIYIYIYIYTHARTHTHTQTHTHTRTHMNTYVHTCTYMNTHTHSFYISLKYTYMYVKRKPGKAHQSQRQKFPSSYLYLFYCCRA